MQNNQQNFPRLVPKGGKSEPKTHYTAAELVGKMELQKNLKFFPVIYEAVTLVGLVTLCLEKFQLGYPTTALVSVGITVTTNHLLVMPWVKEYSHNLRTKIHDMVRVSPECQQYINLASAEDGEFGMRAREILRKVEPNKAG